MSNIISDDFYLIDCGCNYMKFCVTEVI